MADAIACVRFATRRELEGALRAGLVHVDARLGVRAKRDGDALLVDVACLEAPPSAMPIEHVDGLCAYASWFEVLPAQRVLRRPEVDDELLFVGPAEAMRTWLVQLLSWGAESVRAACVEGDVYVLARRSPAYLQLRAEEAQSDTDVRAYARVRGDVFVELGWSHALASMTSAEGELVCVDRTGRVRRTATPIFERTVEHVGIARLDTHVVAVSSSAATWLRALEIRPRLMRAVRERAPTLWWVKRDAVKQLDAWVQSAGEGALLHYEVQVLSRDDEVSVLVRGMHSEADAAVPLEALELAALEGAPRLFAPANKRLDPPLHEARVLASLDAEGRRDIAFALWQDGDVLCAQPFAQGAFSPLHTWTRIHLARSNAVLSTWASAMHVDLEELDVFATTEAASQAPELADVDRSRRKRTRTKVHAVKPADDVQPMRRAEPSAQAQVRWTLDTEPTEAFIATLEEDVLLRGVSLADAANAEALATLAAAWRGRDEHAQMDALTLEAWRWVGHDRAWVAEQAATLGPSISEGLMRSAVEAIAIREQAPSAVRGALARMLTERAAQVPAPLLLLALQRLVEVSGGDEVLGARMRDLLRPRLSLGLEVGLDVPAFLRREATHGGGLTQAQRGQLLGQFLAALETMKRASSALEAPWSKTLRWARWLVAIGYARLGLRQEAEALQHAAGGEGDDALEAALLAMMRERCDHALRGAPQPLALETMQRIEALDPRDLTRYKFDRIAGALSLLGATTRDAFRAFADADDAEPELAHRVAQAPEPALQVALFDQQLAMQLDSHEHDLALVDALVILQVASARARVKPMLTRASTRPAALAIRTFAALARSVRIWGDDAEREALRSALIALRDAHSAESILDALGAHADLLDVLLRRVDGGVAEPFVAWLDAALLGETVSTDGRLAVLAKLAAVDPSRPSLDAELERVLARLGSTKGDARLKLVRALVHALLALDASHVSRVLDAIHACIAGTTDAYQTSTHLCLSALAMVDAVVLPVSELHNVDGERVRWKSAHHLATMLRTQRTRSGDDEA